MALEGKYEDIPSDPPEEVPPTSEKCFNRNEVLLKMQTVLREDG
jgi:hypothetical protein